MARGRREALGRQWWDHTSALCAVIINFAPFNQKQVTPASLNPYNQQKKAKPLMIPLSKLMELIDLGCGGGRK
jgi:hypothetical protein